MNRNTTNTHQWGYVLSTEEPTERDSMAKIGTI